jgi:hypothetical protein
LPNFHYTLLIIKKRTVWQIRINYNLIRNYNNVMSYSDSENNAYFLVNCNLAAENKGLLYQQKG